MSVQKVTVIKKSQGHDQYALSYVAYGCLKRRKLEIVLNIGKHKYIQCSNMI